MTSNIGEQTGRVVSADEARRVREYWPDDLRLDWPDESDLASNLAHTVVVQAEQIAAVLALHSSHYGGCRACTGRVFVPHPCQTARALGVSGE